MDLIQLDREPALAPIRVVAQPSIFRKASSRIIRTIPHGATLLELVLETGMGELRDDAVHLPGKVVCTIDGNLIEREYWHCLRPRPGRLVNIYLVPQGQREAIIIGASLAIGIAAVMTGGAAGALAPVGYGALVGGLTTAAIAVGGNYALTALVPLEEDNSGTSRPKQNSAVTGDSNPLDKDSLVPLVLAEAIRVVPKHWALPYTEAAGSDTYWRMLLVFGQGPLRITDPKAGDTLLSANPDAYDFQIREGRLSDPPLTLFTKDITEVSPAATFGEVRRDTPQIQTMEPGSTEGTVDITFRQGIYQQGKVNKDPYTVIYTVERSPTGAGTWVDYVTGGSITEHSQRHETTSFRRFSYRAANLNPSITYDVRVRRVNGDNDKDHPSEMLWTALRSIQPNDPRPDKTLACIAIRAKKTGSGTVPVISATCGTYALDWNGITWVEAVTGNPSSLARLLLQSVEYNPNPAPDVRMDLPNWQEFHDHCVTNSFVFNHVFDDEGVIMERVATILTAGRGRLIPPDTKYAVAIDRNGKSISGMITPRNSSDFKGTHFLRDEVQALRVRFINQNTWQNDERLVFADGYDENNVEDGRIEAYNLIGITDPDLAWRFGRWRLADIALRLDLYEVTQGIESLQHVPGDLVAFQHHAALLGLTRGRIKSITTGGDLVVDQFNSLSLDSGLDGGESWVWRFVDWNTSLLSGNGDEAFKAWSGYNPGGGGQTPAAMGVVLHEVSGGTLKMYGRQNPNPTGYPTSYLAGMISNELSDSRLYGTWEIRARFNVSKGHHWAIWMVATGDDGLGLLEIDIAQFTNDATAFSLNRIFMNSWGAVIRFVEPWTGANGAAWPTARWETATIEVAGAVDIQTNQGRISASGAAYAKSKIFAKGQFEDFNLTTQFTLADTGEQYHFLSFLTGGAWSATLTDQPHNGYAVMIIPTGLVLYRYVNSVRLELADYSPGALGTSAWNLRLQVQDGHIRVKLWQGTEPHNVWVIDVTDASLQTGVFGFSTSNGNATAVRQILWDTLTILSLPPAQVVHGGTTPASEETNLGAFIQLGNTAAWQDWHTFKFVWTATGMEWWMDDVLRMSCANYITVPMHLMISPEIGGLWEGDPDGTTVWPSRAEIDYVRIPATSVSSVTIDDQVTMEVGKTYAARVRLIAPGGADQYVVRAVNTVVGSSNSLTFTTPFDADAAPKIGDLLAFGETGLATVNALIKDVIPGPDQSARIMLVDEAPAVNLADQGPIPPFTSQISLPGDFFGIAPAVPVIQSIAVHDISHPSQPDFITQQQVVVHLAASSSQLPPPTGFELQIKRIDQDIYQRQVSYPPDTVELAIENVASNATYDVRVRATGRSPRGIPNESAWSAAEQIYVPLPRVTYATIAQVAGLELQGQGNDTTFEGPDANLVWRLTATSGAVQIHADQEQLINFVDPQFAWYEVQVINPDSGRVRRQVLTTVPYFRYTYADNKEDSRKESVEFGTTNRALRSFAIQVNFVDRFGRRDAGQTLVVSNPAPAVPDGIIVSGKIQAINVRTDPPNDDDFDGTIVYVGALSGFDPAAPSTAVFKDLNNTVLIPEQPAGVTKYVRIAHADRFSEAVTDLNLSSEIAVVIESPTGPPRFTADGITFKANGAANQVTWTAGTMHVQHGATVVSEAVIAGSATWTTGTLWLYYVRGFGAIQATTNAAVANNDDRVALAQYRGGRRLTDTTGEIELTNIISTAAAAAFSPTINSDNHLITLAPITTANNPIEITGSARVLFECVRDRGNTNGAHCEWNIMYRRDGANIMNVKVARGAAGSGGSSGVDSPTMAAVWAGAITWTDNPGAGTYTYSMYCRPGASNTDEESVTAQGLTMSAIETLY